MAITDERATAPGNARFCTGCGYLVEDDRFCPGCGKPNGASVGTAAPQHSPKPRRSHTALIFAGGALGLVVVALAAIILLTSSSGTDPSTAYRQKLTGALAPVLAANATLSSSLQSLHGKDTQAASRGTSQAQSAITAARGAVAAMTVPGASVQLSQQVQQALAQESGYLQAASETLSSPAADNVSQLQPLARGASSALMALGDIAPGAGTSLGGTDALSSWASGRIAGAVRAHAAAARKSEQHAIQQAASKAAQQSAAGSASGSSTAVPPPAPNPNGCNCGVQNQPVQCGTGVAGSSGMTCPFAENAFYDYWQASGGNPTQPANIVVWSAPGQHWYSLACSSGDGVVDCTGTNSSGILLDARFTQAAVSAYTNSEAAAYAASGKRGP